MKSRKKTTAPKTAAAGSEIHLLRQQNQQLIETNIGYVKTILELLATIDNLTRQNLALSSQNLSYTQKTNSGSTANPAGSVPDASGSIPNDKNSIGNEKNSIPNESGDLRNDNIGFPNDNNSFGNDNNGIPNENKGVTNENNAIPNDKNATSNSIATPEEAIESFTKRWSSISAKVNFKSKYIRKDVVASQAKFFFSVSRIRQGTSTELFAAAAVKPTSGMRYIAILKELGFIQFVGPRSNGFYRLTPSALDFVSGKTNIKVVQ